MTTIPNKSSSGAAEKSVSSPQVLIAISCNAAMGISYHPHYPGFEDDTKLSFLRHHPESRFSSIQKVIFDSAQYASGDLVAKLLSCEIFKNFNQTSPKRKIGCSLTYFDENYSLSADVYASGLFPGVSDSFCNTISKEFRRSVELTCHSNLQYVLSYVRRKSTTPAASVSDAVIFLSLNSESQLEQIVQLSKLCRCHVVVVIAPDLNESSTEIIRQLNKLSLPKIFLHICTEIRNVRKCGHQIVKQIVSPGSVVEDCSKIDRDETIIKINFGSMPTAYAKVPGNDDRPMRISSLDICGFLDAKLLGKDLKGFGYESQCTMQKDLGFNEECGSRKKYTKGKQLMDLLTYGLWNNSQTALVKIDIESAGIVVKTRHGLLFSGVDATDNLVLSVLSENCKLWLPLLSYKIGVKQEEALPVAKAKPKQKSEAYQWDDSGNTSRSLLYFVRCARSSGPDAAAKLLQSWDSLALHCRLVGQIPTWLMDFLGSLLESAPNSELRRALLNCQQEARLLIV